MQLIRNGKSVPTFFDLVGAKEDDMTAGLAFVCAKSPVFLRRMFKEVFGHCPRDIDSAQISIQTHRPNGGGITDVEIQLGERYFAIIEAKRGVQIPSLAQLKKYAPHIKKRGAAYSQLVSLSNTSQLLADTKLPKNVKGVPIAHRSWRRIKTLADESIKNESNSNKRLLREFSKYLGVLLGMENIYSNMVYVVSLGSGNPTDWGISWIDIVEKRKRYFYPAGANWPDPPNYMAFRYHGRLQSIYHVKKFSIVSDPTTIFKEASKNRTWDPPCYVLTLEKPIRLEHEVKCGPRIRFSARCWCMLDTLLTCKTLSEAKTETEKRIKANK